MHRLRPLSALVPLLVLIACGEEQPPTSPTSPDATGPQFSAAAGLKVVNSLADPGNGVCNATQCTLREAINDPQSTEISFVSGLTGTITLARPTAGGGPLLIAKTLTITGPSTGILIRRQSSDPFFRILRIESGVTLALANLSFRGGRTNSAGGPGIVNRGSVTLTDGTISANDGEPGGGIENFGGLTLLRSTVANVGTGILNHDNAVLRLRRSNVQHNSGTGIFNAGGDLTLTRSYVADNSDGGINSRYGRVTLSESIIADNTGGGGVISARNATLTITNSTIARNSSAGDGGGINSSGSPGGPVTIVGSTIVNNSAAGRGGGIFNEIDDPFSRTSSRVRVTNSTVSKNVAASGGGIFSTTEGGATTVIVIHSTVTLNSARDAGGGLRSTTPGGNEDDSSVIGLGNSLVAQNTAPTGPDLTGDVFGGFSLIGNGSGSGFTNGTNGNLVGSANAPIDPKLGPLALNSGPTRTHALLAGSPAIDAASSSDCTATDQRGVSRPQGAACDMGSYEREQ